MTVSAEDARLPSTHMVHAGHVMFAQDAPVSFILGPCAMESREHALKMADALSGITARLGCGFVFKSSFDKANRTSLNAPRGLGLEAALRVFEEVKAQFGCPVLTDVHSPEQCAAAASVVDVLQIPAFLSRQTDLLVAAAKTGRAINVKKGQFLAPWDMEHVLAKVVGAGNEQVMACERGTSFGYNTLVTDMRGLPQMAAFGYPIIFDATHSVQQPGGQGGASGGQGQFVPVLARAAVSLGVAGVFMETHDDPANAFSDGPNMVPLEQLEAVLRDLMAFDALAKSRPLSI